ncbi:MAG: (d)CMP kinase [Coprobacillus sp.]|nr:(d)CMP kinase [Coprobacillus sp.]
MKVSIAIDGPAAAGKSTVAKIVAKRLNISYIDTGAMYRAVTWYCVTNGIDCQDEAACSAIISNVHIDLKLDDTVWCNGTNITEAIREPFVSSQVSYIASYKDIRLEMVKQQRAMAADHSVIMDGRDIGTYVLPDADIKIYQIASIETRAIRRYEEDLEKGIQTSLEEVEDELRKRDYIDSHRDFAPLKPAPDSILLDTSYLTVEQVVEEIINIVKKKMGEE